MKPKMTEFNHFHCITRISEGNHYYLAIADLDRKEIVETFTPKLSQKTAKRLGQELAIELKVQYSAKIPPPIQQKFKAQRRKDWQEEQQQRWSQWLAQFESEELACAQGIRVMNSWIKELGEIRYSFDGCNIKPYLVKEYSDGRERVCVDFAYSIKDFFLQKNTENIVETRRVRQEQRGWLYEYQLNIEGIKFVFHGYFQPAEISEELAASPEQFRSGKLLSEEEKNKIEEITGIKNAIHFTSMMGWRMLGKRLF